MLMGFKHLVLEKTKPKQSKKKVEKEMKKEHAILVIVTATSIFLTSLFSRFIFSPRETTPAVVATNAPPPIIAAQTNAPATQVDLLAAELEELKAKERTREERLQRLLALNEEVRRERETNIITVPVTVNVTNASPVVINGTFNIGGSSVPPARKQAEPKAPKTKTRTPMYTITNSTSSVTVSGTTTVSETHTSVQNFLPPGRRSLLGVILGGRANPIPTTMPSGQSVQQGQPPTPVVVVQQPYRYGYGGGYGYGYPYRRMPAQSGENRRLFGVHFHTR